MCWLSLCPLRVCIHGYKVVGREWLQEDKKFLVLRTMHARFQNPCSFTRHRIPGCAHVSWRPLVHFQWKPKFFHSWFSSFCGFCNRRLLSGAINSFAQLQEEEILMPPLALAFCALQPWPGPALLVQFYICSPVVTRTRLRRPLPELKSCLCHQHTL